MAQRITVAPTVTDARADSYLRTLKSLFPKTKLKSVAVAQAYTVDAKLSAEELRRAGERLTNPVTEAYSTGAVIAPRGYSYAIEIGFHPGVTDNVGKTARQTVEDCIGRKFKEGADVYTSVFIFLTGAVSKQEAERMSRELYNPLIERARVYSVKEELAVTVPKVHLHARTRVDDVDLDVSDDELVKIGKQGIADKDGTRPDFAKATSGRRGPLALSLGAMKTIQAYFAALGRNPTDIELESLAQTWSEHCKHTIFADPLDEVEDLALYQGCDEKVRKIRVRRFLRLGFADNAGGIIFDDKYLVTHKVGTHNSPSALDPFGGAIGNSGVNRDSMGFGLGSNRLRMCTQFCVADPRDTTPLYRDAAKQQPLLPAPRCAGSSKASMRAVISGIPPPLGFLAWTRATAASAGICRHGRPHSAQSKGKKMYEKQAQAGGYIVGGRTRRS